MPSLKTRDQTIASLAVAKNLLANSSFDKHNNQWPDFKIIFDVLIYSLINENKNVFEDVDVVQLEQINFDIAVEILSIIKEEHSLTGDLEETLYFHIDMIEAKLKEIKSSRDKRNQQLLSLLKNIFNQILILLRNIIKSILDWLL